MHWDDAWVGYESISWPTGDFHLIQDKNNNSEPEVMMIIHLSSDPFIDHVSTSASTFQLGSPF